MKASTQGLRPTQHTRRLAERSDHLAALVWQKAIANSTPQVRQMLITFAHLRSAAPVVFAEKADPATQLTDAKLLRLIGLAEAVLTDGFNQSMVDQAMGELKPIERAA